jgi:hypothetical protein
MNMFRHPWLGHARSPAAEPPETSEAKCRCSEPMPLVQPLENAPAPLAQPVNLVGASL